MSNPPDTSKKIRKLHKTDLKPLGTSALAAQPGAFLRDPIVSTTNTNLTNTHTAGDNEPSIAVNPSNPNEIVIASFTGSSGFYRSTDGGNTWTFTNTYTQPPGQGGIPNDQQEEFTRGNLLAAVFLDGPNNIMTGTTANAGSQASWNWPLDGSGNVVLTNTTGLNNSDQPWLVTAPRPGNLSQDNIYSAYDNFLGAPDMQVNVANAADPPNFTNDVTVGTAAGCCGDNPGLRLATDRRTGFTYAVWQTTTGPNGDNSVNAQIHLNRTTDGGQTWTLNGNAGGVVVASGASNQRTPKFGTVNALIGGVHHAAVDPVTGDVYVVYACGDGVGGDNPLCTVRVHDDGSGTGTMAADAPQTVTTLNSALPSIAVASNGVIGVLFTSFDGFSSDGFPVYTAHLSMSDDHGATWSDQVLETSLSPVTDNGNNRQRVLGDYQELMAVGRTFYGTFTGNGAGFGRTVSNMDPIFFKTFAGGPAIAVTGDLGFGTVARGTSATRDITIQNVGTSALVVNGVSMGAGSDPAFSIVATPGTPATIQPSDSVTYQVRFSPPGGSTSATRSGTVVIQSNDPDNPTVTLSATGQPG
ncbi:MAG: choice-of-anchor D domain-containing protein, partial [Actinomycetes bacterium]